MTWRPIDALHVAGSVEPHSLAFLGTVYCVRPAAACFAYSFMSCIQSPSQIGTVCLQAKIGNETLLELCSGYSSWQSSLLSFSCSIYGSCGHYVFGHSTKHQCLVTGYVMCTLHWFVCTGHHNGCSGRLCAITQVNVQHEHACSLRRKPSIQPDAQTAGTWLLKAEQHSSRRPSCKPQGWTLNGATY